MRSNSVLVQWAWLKSGQGIGLVHDFAYQDDLDLVRVYPEFEVDRSYFLTTRRDDNRFKRMETLVERIHTDICDALATR